MDDRSGVSINIGYIKVADSLYADFRYLKIDFLQYGVLIRAIVSMLVDYQSLKQR